MKPNAIKGVLFSLVSVMSVPALSQEKQGEKPTLILIEELPVETRVVVQDRIIKHLKLNPKAVTPNSILAVDEKGNIYVVDKEWNQISKLGMPSCPGSM